MSEANKTFIAAVFSGAVLFGTALPAQSTNQTSKSVQKAIHEAENLSLMKDRILATNVLLRNIKKANKEEARPLKEKLSQLARYFYTDKGFQNYLEGKELLEKQKYPDAVERLAEADDLENGNIDVLHLLTLAQLWQKKAALADSTNKRALQVCPFDIELQRDAMAAARDNGDWPNVIKVGEFLVKDFGDNSAMTLKDLGLAQYKYEKSDSKADLKADALRNLEFSFQKDSKQPETIYWLAQMKPPLEATKLLAKYAEICKNATRVGIEHAANDRETAYCSHLSEAEKGAK